MLLYCCRTYVKKSKICTYVVVPPEKRITCCKNWKTPDGSSGMEASIIVEGFKESEQVHGIRYHKFIADVDSNAYKRILDSRPYKNLTVQKVECRNHLLRNICKQ